MNQLLIAPIIFLIFLSGFLELFKTYSSFWLFENALTAFVIFVLYVFYVFKYGLQKEKDEKTFSGYLICAGVLIACAALLLNNFLGGFQIVPPILTYLTIYIYLGFWLKPTFWKRSIFVFILLILTLPILERLQKFIGFPLQLLTAKLVSFLLQLVGAGNVSNSTIIMTENYATTIDLPCSGVNSIYSGGIILLAVYFLERIKVSFKSIILACSFFALLIFFNIWRVFVLVYVYGILHLVQIGDGIHIFLGVTGFLASCLFLWYGSRYCQKSLDSSNKTPKKNLNLFNRKNTVRFTLITLIITGILTNTLIKSPVKKPTSNDKSVVFKITNTQLKLIPFNEKEKALFFNSDVIYSSKYSLKWRQKNMNLLLVKSKSARTHHDPELCLQGLGYRIIQEESQVVANIRIKQLKIQISDNFNSPKATVYYWYVSKDKIIIDYSERVWEQFNKPSQEWILAELSYFDSQQLTNKELGELFNLITRSIRSQLL
jgi:exosortase O